MYSTARGTKAFCHEYKNNRQPAQIHIHVHLCLAGASMHQRCLCFYKMPSASNRVINISARRGRRIFLQLHAIDIHRLQNFIYYFTCYFICHFSALYLQINSFFTSTVFFRKRKEPLWKKN